MRARRRGSSDTATEVRVERGIWDVDEAAIEAAKSRSQDLLALPKLGLYYIPDLLPAEQFEEIRAEYELVKHCMEEESQCGGAGHSLAPGRYVCKAPKGGHAEKSLRSRRLAGAIRDRISLAPSLHAGCDFPVEYRHYTPGVGMEWHKDVGLTKPPQLELVYTIENSSDSVTRWAPRGYSDLVQNRKLQEVWTAPNSGLFVVAEGPVHMVTKLSYGHRAILKAVFLQGPKKTCKRSEHWDDYLQMATDLPKA